LKIKILNEILIIDILTILLILTIVLFPDSPARIILGLPVLLFFPGYTLMAALIPRPKTRQNPIEATGQTGENNRKTDTDPLDSQYSPENSRDNPALHPDGEEAIHPNGGVDGLERLALSFIMSIAVTALSGLVLNFTPWKIKLIPVLCMITLFILVMSTISLIRIRRSAGYFRAATDHPFSVPGWTGSAWTKTLSIILAIAIIGSIGTLGFTVAKPKTGVPATEFYLLGMDGSVDRYPLKFKMEQGAITEVSYDNGAKFMAGSTGRVTLGIINHDGPGSRYSLVLQIDAQAAPVIYNGSSLEKLSGITLKQDEKWENEIGFAPQHSGSGQKVDFILYAVKPGSVVETMVATLDLSVDVQVNKSPAGK
jgi:uncharacterized membrane protein